MELLVLLIGFGGGALVCWLILNKRNSRNLVRMQGSQEAISKLTEQLDDRNSELQQKVQNENQLNDELSQLQSRYKTSHNQNGKKPNRNIHPENYRPASHTHQQSSYHGPQGNPHSVNSRSNT